VTCKFRFRGRPLFTAGAHVAAGDTLVRRARVGPTVAIDGWEISGLRHGPPKLKSKVSVGDSVSSGQILATLERGKRTFAMVAPGPGIVTAVMDWNAMLVLRMELIWDDCTAPTDGLVVDTGPAHLDMEIDGSSLPGRDGRGLPAWGRLRIVEHEVELEQVMRETDPAIIFCPAFVGTAILRRAWTWSATEGCGIAVGSASLMDLQSLSDATGSLVLLAGYGTAQHPRRVNDRMHAFLARLDGQMVGLIPGERDGGPVLCLPGVAQIPENRLESGFRVRFHSGLDPADGVVQSVNGSFAVVACDGLEPVRIAIDQLELV
jgi:hypothetical protein